MQIINHIIFTVKRNQGKINDEIFLIIIKYVDLKDVILKFMRLSWSIRNLIKSDNYTLYKKFLKFFNLNKELRRSDLVAFIDVFQLIKDNVSLPLSRQPSAIIPAVFYSNCSVQDNELSLFAHNIFNVGTSFMNYCSGDIPETDLCGVNIQAYMGKECNMQAYNTLN